MKMFRVKPGRGDNKPGLGPRWLLVCVAPYRPLGSRLKTTALFSSVRSGFCNLGSGPKGGWQRLAVCEIKQDFGVKDVCSLMLMRKRHKWLKLVSGVVFSFTTVSQQYRTRGRLPPNSQGYLRNEIPIIPTWTKLSKYESFVPYLKSPLQICLLYNVCTSLHVKSCSFAQWKLSEVLLAAQKWHVAWRRRFHPWAER